MSESDESWEDFSIDEEDVYSTTTADSDSDHGSSPKEREGEGSDDEAEGEDRRGAEPYRFEPLAVVADVAPDEPGDNNQDRLLNTAW